MSTATQTDLQTFVIDGSHSRFGFSVRHLGFSKVRGSFESFEGTIRMEGDDLSTLQASAKVQTASVDTHEEKRDGHLRSEDFFHVEEHPVMTFESTDVRDVKGNQFTLVGDLTIRGVTKQVEFDAEFLGSGKDPWGNLKLAFEAATKINRKDFGLNWNAVLETGGFLVSEDVEITLEIQAAPAQDAA
ncbi:MAG: YceI family protein [Rhodothermales bacterium]